MYERSTHLLPHHSAGLAQRCVHPGRMGINTNTIHKHIRHFLPHHSVGSAQMHVHLGHVGMNISHNSMYTPLTPTIVQGWHHGVCVQDAWE